MFWPNNTNNFCVFVCQCHQLFNKSTCLSKLICKIPVKAIYKRVWKYTNLCSWKTFWSGPCIREIISYGLHKTRTPRINGTKFMFTASLSPGLFWPRSFGLSLSKPRLNLTWKCSYKCTHRLSAACWTRERLLHMLAHALFSIIYQTFRPKDERCIGGKMTCCTREPEISSIFSTSSIAGISLSIHSTDRWRTRFRRAFRTSFTIA